MWATGVGLWVFRTLASSCAGEDIRCAAVGRGFSTVGKQDVGSAQTGVRLASRC